MSGKLTRHTCNKCGKVKEVIYPLLYHDMSRKLMVYLAASKNHTDALNVPLDMMEGYTLRVVESSNHLVEKIFLANEMLDDRFIEVFKLLLRRQAKIPDDSLFLFAGVNKEDRSLQFVIVKEDGNQSLSVSRDTFDNAINRLSHHVNIEDQNSGDWKTVDMNYALSALENGLNRKS